MQREKMGIDLMFRNLDTYQNKFLTFSDFF
jgi:hypothetical protein